MSADWPFLLSLVRDHLENGGTIEPLLEQVGRDRIGLVSWATIRQLPFSSKARAEIGQLDADARGVLLEFARRTTPFSRYMFRNTRGLLRRYQEKGLLGDRRVPARQPEPIWIPMEAQEREPYDRIEEYISDFYRKYEEQRTGLGFIMTVYRRRLTSSFNAISKSFERRLAFLRGEPDASPTSGLSEEDYEEDDLSEDALENVVPDSQALAAAEIGYIEDFLQDLHALGSDSKAARLLEDLPKLLSKRETIIIFMLYTDTMDWLRERLRAVYGGQVACYSGRGGEVWDGQGWQRISKERIKEEFAKERVKILLGTDALSEGLNLQSCGMMINYDMPWNPMRVEQRIGRIDRIEQRYPEVWIRNYFYEDTVEANVYRALEGRISWFETVVGKLQPILAQVERTIQKVAMSDREARPARLASAIEEIKQQLDEQEVNAFDLGSYLGLDETPPTGPASPPVTRKDIERTLLGSDAARKFFHPHPQLANAYMLELDGQSFAATFNRELFSRHPGELHLLSYGELVFHRLLERLCGTDEPELPPWLIRFTSEDSPLHGWWRLEGAKATPVTSLMALEKALAEAAPAPDPSVRAVALHAFERSVTEGKSKELVVTGMRLKARKEALRERGQHLLLQSAYLDLALSAGESSLFGPEAIIGLKRHGFPFTALIAQVTVQGIEPSPADPYWEEVKGSPAESLRRRFEEVKRRAKELVTELSRFVEKPQEV